MSANNYSPRVFTCPFCAVKSNGFCLKPACIAAIQAQQTPDEPDEQEPETQLPIDARIIALDETSNYYLEPEKQRLIRAIKGVYLYDRNRHTHCCELTPSYYLIFLYNSVNLTDEGLALDNEARGELYDEYEYGTGGDNCYMHIRIIERLAEKAEAGEYYVYGDPKVSFDKSDYNEQIEGLVEYFQCNWTVW